MGKVILFNLMTLDGFFEGAEQDISWHHVDDEFNQFALRQLDQAAGLLFGRITYQLMAGYWPSAEAQRDDPGVAEKMNTIPKVVFSRTLESADWSNTRLVKSNAGEEVHHLRLADGEYFIFGSAKLADSLASASLIDEYRVMVNPLILGTGQPLFTSPRPRQDLRLIDARTFRNGNVLLIYQPVDVLT